MAQAGDLTEGPLADRIVSLLKYQTGDPAQAELASGGTYNVERFLERVADEDQGADLFAVVLALSVRENLPKLSGTSDTPNTRHKLAKPPWISNPR